MEETTLERLKRYGKYTHLSYPEFHLILMSAIEEIEKLTIAYNGWRNTSITATRRVMELSEQVKKLKGLLNYDMEEVYIIDRLEHGNGGVYGHKRLDKLPLKDALKKVPSDYGINSKMWGFWPVISIHSEDDDGSNNYSYYWDEDDETWRKHAQ